MPLGAHMSTAGGVDQAIRRGQSIGCEAIQIFSKNANRWKARDFTDQEVAAFREAYRESGISAVLVHTSYLINIASPEDELWEKSVQSLLLEIGRCAVLGLPYLVLHPGAHKGSGEEAGLRRIVQGLNEAFTDSKECDVGVLLEVTSGQGTVLGCRFEQLAAILERCDYPERLGVCFDTCHAFTAGYDQRTAEAYSGTFGQFDSIIGLSQLKAVHLNDSKGAFGSRLDRHEQIGQGQIGLEGFRLLLNDPRLAELPMILETPKGPKMLEDVENLAVLRSLIAS